MEWKSMSKNDDPLSLAACASACSNYKYFGMMWEGYDCFCGNEYATPCSDFPKLKNSDCPNKLGGDDFESNAVYQNSYYKGSKTFDESSDNGCYGKDNEEKGDDDDSEEDEDDDDSKEEKEGINGVNDFTYLGCYSSIAGMKWKSESNNWGPLSLAACASACSEHKYFGMLSWGNDCYCGDRVRNAMLEISKT